MSAMIHLAEEGMFLRDTAPPEPGLTLLFIHGLGESGLCFEELARRPELKALRLLIPDLPGYGRSPWPAKPLALVLPNSVDLLVTDTPPAIKGATAPNQYKKATCETGLEVMVPPFVEPNEMIRVDTRSGEYLERVR